MRLIKTLFHMFICSWTVSAFAGNTDCGNVGGIAYFPRDQALTVSAAIEQAHAIFHNATETATLTTPFSGPVRQLTLTIKGTELFILGVAEQDQSSIDFSDFNAKLQNRLGCSEVVQGVGDMFGWTPEGFKFVVGEFEQVAKNTTKCINFGTDAPVGTGCADGINNAVIAAIGAHPTSASRVISNAVDQIPYFISTYGAQAAVTGAIEYVYRTDGTSVFGDDNPIADGTATRFICVDGEAQTSAQCWDGMIQNKPVLLIQGARDLTYSGNSHQGVSMWNNAEFTCDLIAKVKSLGRTLTKPEAMTYFTNYNASHVVSVPGQPDADSRMAQLEAFQALFIDGNGFAVVTPNQALTTCVNVPYPTQSDGSGTTKAWIPWVVSSISVAVLATAGIYYYKVYKRNANYPPLIP